MLFADWRTFGALRTRAAAGGEIDRAWRNHGKIEYSDAEVITKLGCILILRHARIKMVDRIQCLVASVQRHPGIDFTLCEGAPG